MSITCKLAELSPEELRVMHASLLAARDGPFFPDWEIETLMGLTREEFGTVIRTWQDFDDLEETANLAISNAIVNLIGYPHGQEDEVVKRTGATLEHLEEILRRAGAGGVC